MKKQKSRRKLLGVDVGGHLDTIATGAKYLFKPRATLMYPEVIQDFAPNYKGMLKLDIDTCISCKQCARICPSNAIKMYKEEPDSHSGRGLTGMFLRQFFANHKHPGLTYERCIFCGFCVDICPVNALEMSLVHDEACFTLEGELLKPADFAKGPPVEKIQKKVKPVFDEKRGLKYEPV
jgi:NADH-quinone oxidoreductase subunit I